MITPRPLPVIVAEIRKDWKNVWFGAVPYLQAIGQMNSVDEDYGADTGKSMVLYFLGNAAQWKGETARRVKAELKALCK